MARLTAARRACENDAALMTLSRDWLAVLAAALLIALVKLGIASGVPW